MEELEIRLKDLDQIALISIKPDRTKDVLKYKELLKEIIKTTLTIEEFEVQSTVGILLKQKNFALVALTFGVLEANLPFCYFDKKDNLQTDMIDFNSRYIFTEYKIDLPNLMLLKSLKICGKEIHFYKLDIVRNLQHFDDPNLFKLCYVVKTSGTSGRKKMVYVTYKSICPNISSLQQKFQLTPNDIILSMSPVTFDPFVIDLFLAFRAGCTLLFVDNSLRFDPFLFTKGESTGVTFLQMTPTLFQQFGIENIQRRILSDDSSLKYLVLGGESFPLPREISKWQNWENENRKRIFNIYGVTEMSCWATIYEVTKNDLDDSEIPIGTTLDEETTCAYYSRIINDYDPNNCIEELLLATKSRICFIDNLDKKFKDWKNSEAGLYVIQTGDMVRRFNGKMYWYGRTNDIVKRFGERVDLNQIEKVAANFLEKSQLSCVFVKKKIVLFYQSNDDETKEALINHLKLKLNASEIPDDVRRIDFLPRNEHGKVSKEKLRELYKEILERNKSAMDVEDVFIDAINQMFKLSLQKPSTLENGDEPDGKKRRCDIDSTFAQLGGKSFDALRIVMKIEDNLSLVSGDLLPKLLDDNHTIKEICMHLNEMKKSYKIKKIEKKNSSIFKKFCAFDLEKCVDSNPALLRINNSDYISIGSHSHKLINIDCKSLAIISQIELSDRIECEVTQFKDFGLVGCYDGILYCFDVLSGTIKWKFASSGMIKSKPLVIDEETIIFGNYDTSNFNIRCIKVSEEGLIETKWSKMLGKLGILANILQIDDKSIIVATLSSTLHKLNIEDGEEIWSKELSFPIFSSPVKIPSRKEFIVAEVSKTISCFDFDGNLMWNFNKFDGQIFSSFLVTSDVEDEFQIIFGSHDKYLRCLSYKPNAEHESKKIDLKWKVMLQSQIYSTPKIIRLDGRKFIIACSTSGTISFVCPLSGLPKYSKKLPGDIFSSPLIYDATFFVGCRDNFMYGFLL